MPPLLLKGEQAKNKRQREKERKREIEREREIEYCVMFSRAFLSPLSPAKPWQLVLKYPSAGGV